MTAHCAPKSYTVVQEGEEAIADASGQLAGTAWRVHYQCAQP